MKPLAAVGLGSLLICIGCSSAQAGDVASSTTAKPSQANQAAEEKAYSNAFVAISAQFEAIERPSSSLAAEAFLEKLKENHEKERTVIESLSELKPPTKYQEFHDTMVAWKRERWALDEEGIGFLTNKENDKVEELSGRIDDVGVTYTEKIDAIVKAHGYNSTQKFLGIE